MTNAATVVANVIGGMVAGAIGAGVGKDAESPIIKGAVITGLISGGIAATMIALASPPPKQVGTSGLPYPRFP